MAGVEVPAVNAVVEKSAPRKVVVGVAGGIAAYKACHLIRDFKEAGDDVWVVPTESALKFVGQATFEALSGNPVSTTVFDAVDEVRHVKIGQTADLVVVAPATADFMARVASGRGDDLLSATLLVATCPVVLAPAMHTEMWMNPATQANVATLRARGITVLEPAHGRLTGKDTGPGRLPEPSQIAALARTRAAGYPLERTLEGKKVLISAGGTQEAIDPVRYVGNRSSGKQGYALAEIAAHKGAQVTIVAGATEHLETPSGAFVHKVVSAREMREAMLEHAADADVIIMAAAVADFRPENPAASKLKKGHAQESLSTIHMVENPDILRELVQARISGGVKESATIIGFAAETGDDEHSVLDFAKQKVVKKGCDLLMCNDVSGGKVFGQSVNEGFLVSATGEVFTVTAGSKTEVAAQIIEAIESHRVTR
ncbi:bifunctional phosphopantothenoylcysteine decarboxylase/phosphopantothenate--cysteine ligase CoaBC [Corynebacterium sp. SCR221107]|uniref:bifunctional phosphopantothenoylcysteine decarboxylase/phosphopantothenate--cysteine ligase CoaBC n=1 Tax=Corynebacterium sp. SCR221107 TaxID=3017361 RepID=UPI0022EC1B5B|nr:bifunctional phosphopantothenoylcysteine decarboxylase/phosphopantothenate--cysteine ligase CoaBC [Corynebacterium sp. SCR221107]WBT07769.1 bifunctional phosphopantothenoylcysteine decarboxylase/phosphopantothenate--cysteine ligase CoaBC [Corynebacterium sp. SCR221107]